MTATAPTVLVVDDEPINVDILVDYLEDSGYHIETAPDGQFAWDLLESNPEIYDVVILDRMMPGLNGMEVLERIKQHPVLQSVPVILQTALAAREEILEGLQAGAYYYLTKPFDQAMLLSVLTTAIDDRRRYQRALEDSDVASRTFGLLREATFSFRTLGSARDIAVVLANAFPDPRRVAIGLTELLVNAVEHGNLGITYAEKGQLREMDSWEQEVEARLLRPENVSKEVSVRYLRELDRIRVTITDEGEGFNWHDYLEMDPSRAFDTHGRGIAMSRMISFDELAYHGKGNEVEVTVMLQN
ncbi:MAG: response regulator [Chromatiaceae bacterium]|nr:response regulator [Gammaproteobacteria bacterium]MCP5303989.1 response regulator [Chromatiaceae bacterium]MCP5313715.1 response regulator [Chromatiaceae bacterium]